MTQASLQRAHGPTRAGVVATEFALVCPVLILMALACADIGRVSHFYEAVANAARVGAETGASQRFTEFTRPLWEERIHDATLAEMQSLPHFLPDDMVYELSVTELAEGQHLITVEVGYQFNATVAWPGLPHHIDLRKRVSYRQFR